MRVLAPTLLLLSSVLGWYGTIHSSEPLPSLAKPSRDWSLRQTPIVDVARRVRDAVVNIHSERTARGEGPDDLFALAPSQHRINGMGTGIILDARGYIVTNQHVVDEVQMIRVRLADSTIIGAHILARDPENDLALIKVESTKPLPVLPLGTASDLMVGETVIAIGNAYGYDHTVTAGIVSAIGRDVNLNKELSYKALIQTDAAINPGNSGGPLLNVHGELVGVNVAIRAGAQNIGFAIPVDAMIRSAGTMLARKSPVSHGIGVRDEVRTSHEEFVRTVIVDHIEVGAPGDKAGVQRGDVLVKVGEFTIGSSLDLERALIEATPGDKVPVIVRRGTTQLQLEMVVEAGRTTYTAASPSASGDQVWRRLGVRLQPVAPEMVTHNNPQLHGGLMIGDVRPDSGASKAGLQRGDILVGLHTWETLNVDSVTWVLNHPDLSSFNPLRFYILRSGQVHRGFVQAGD
jgi:serine protease Do